MKSFATTAKSFEHLIDQILDRIQASIIANISVDLNEYRKLNWRSMTLLPDDQKQQPSLSQQAAKLVYNFSVKCAWIGVRLSSALSRTFLYGIANKIQDLIFDRIIRGVAAFSLHGAQQLQFDLQYGLFGVFQFYDQDHHTKAKLYKFSFAKLNDACIALNLEDSTIAWFDSMVTQNDGNELELKLALQSIGIYSLSPRTVMQIINKRV